MAFLFDIIYNIMVK